MADKPIPVDVHELYATRMIVLMECHPQSNQYHQIMLNGEQFKIISDALAKCGKEHKCGTPGCLSLVVDDDFTYTLNHDIKSIYRDDEMESKDDE